MEITNYGRTLDDFSIQTAQRTTGQDLGQEDFLKVMVEQLRSQNPLSPQDNSDFFAQIAQFESLDAMREMSKAIAALVDVSGLAQAASLIGREVAATVPSQHDPATGAYRPPEEVVGVVQRVTFENGTAVLHLPHRSVPAGFVREVA